MRVTHVVLSLDVGGLERGVINQIREGRKLGQNVSVICLEKPGELAHQITKMGIRLVDLGKPPGVRVSAMWQMQAALKRLKTDVLHTHQIGSLFYAGPVARVMRIPLVVHTEHGRENYAGRWRTRLLGRLAGIFASRFYCLTADMAENVRRRRIVPDYKIRLIENGIDTELYTQPCDTESPRIALDIPHGVPIVGTVGRLSEIKRQDFLIRAFARVRQSVPAAHLLLVGNGPLLQELQDLVKQLELTGFVHFAGYKVHSAPYLQMMNVFALTSRSEGMPQAALEASVVGLPVVASRVGGLPELIDDGVTGVLFDPADEGALVKSITDLLDDPAKAKKMGAAAKARVEARYQVRRMALDYHEQFLELLNLNGAPVCSRPC